MKSYAWVVSHFGEADYSIPLTLLYKTLAKTVGVTEIAMQAPMLPCGIAAIVVLPLLAGRYVGRPAALVSAWLLAIAPLHGYFSRYARPYAITMLMAVVAFLRWWLTGRAAGQAHRLLSAGTGCAIIAASWLACRLAGGRAREGSRKPSGQEAVYSP